MQSLLWKAVGCNHCDVNCIKKVGLETMMRLVSHRQTAWCLCARLRCPDVTLTCAFCPALTVETQQVRRLQAEHHRHGNPQPAARHPAGGLAPTPCPRQSGTGKSRKETQLETA